MNRILALFTLVFLPLATWAQDSSAEEDFFGEGTDTVSTEKATTVDPTAQLSAAGVQWGGTVASNATWGGGWVGQWPDATDPTANWSDSLSYNLKTTLFLDSRPDKDFRFRLSLQTGYPFTNDKDVVTKASPETKSTLQIPNLKVWELFTDVTVADTLFLRFGKQSASWGASYFYSPGDVISLTAKDASDPTAQREGPVALKATVPFPFLRANVTGFVIARESYFADELPSLKNLGYALQGDVLVGDAQLSLGGFYQRDNAPKLVGTLNTGLGFLNLPVLSDINLFSEAVFSYGSDVLKGTGSHGLGAFGTGFAALSPWDMTWYYTGTLGASYSNSDANFTLRAEYLYNPFGSTETDAAQRAFNTMTASLAGYYTTLGGTTTADRDYGFGDAATPGVHYLTAVASLSKLFGNDKLGFSTFWQQNLSDASGWVKPSFSLQAWDQLSFTWGITAVYGGDDTQYPLQFQAYDQDQQPLGAKRVTLNVGVTFGTGKY